MQKTITPDGGLILVLSPGRGDQPTAPEMVPTFVCDDLPETHAQLRSRSVDFPEPPVELGFGWWCALRGSRGNRLALQPCDT